jgi:hypothetical protein
MDYISGGRVFTPGPFKILHLKCLTQESSNPSILHNSIKAKHPFISQDTYQVHLSKKDLSGLEPFRIRIYEFKSTSNPKSSNFSLFSKRKEAKNRSTGMQSGSFGTCDPGRTRTFNLALVLSCSAKIHPLIFALRAASA